MMKRLASHEVVPTIRALEERLDHIREGELERYRGSLASLSPEQRQAVEALTRGILNKILHGPVTELKSRAGEPGQGSLVQLIHKIFGL